MRDVNVSEITKNIKEMCIEANHFLSEDMKKVFKNAVDSEESPLGKQVLNQLNENLSIAASDMIPICQDTGMAVIFINVGQEVHFTGGDITDAINVGGRVGYVEGYLRKSVVRDPIERENTKDNTPAVIHYDIVPGDRIDITIAPKGFGSENMSRVFMLKPADGIEGVKNADKFAAVLKKAAEKRKPVVILKAGRSAKGGAIAASHTGSLSGSDASFDAVLKKFGAIRVDDLEELIAMSLMLSTMKRMPEKATFASMNLSGGETGICADVGSLNGIEYPDFTEETLKKLKEQLPSYASPNNPLDMTASLSYDADLYAGALRTVMDDPNIGMVLIGYTLLLEIADPCIHYMYKGIEKVVQEKGGNCKPIAMIPFAENTRNPEYQEKLFQIGVPVLPPPVYAFKLLRHLADFIAYEPETKTLELAVGHPKSEETQALSEHESKQELKVYGVPVPDEVIVTSKEEAAQFAKNHPDPLVMKVESADILHKSDVGGVKLNVCGPEAAEKAYEEIMESVTAKRPDAHINGILTVPMLDAGVEIIIGVNNDPQFGPMIMVGMGGVFVEVFKDVALYPAPLKEEEALEMLKSLKSFKLLNGYRGTEKCDIKALCQTIVAISNYAQANKDVLKELDINPLFVYPEGKGVGVADALIVKRK